MGLFHCYYVSKYFRLLVYVQPLSIKIFNNWRRYQMDIRRIIISPYLIEDVGKIEFFNVSQAMALIERNYISKASKFNLNSFQIMLIYQNQWNMHQLIFAIYIMSLYHGISSYTLATGIIKDTFLKTKFLSQQPLTMKLKEEIYENSKVNEFELIIIDRLKGIKKDKYFQQEKVKQYMHQIGKQINSGHIFDHNQKIFSKYLYQISSQKGKIQKILFNQQWNLVQHTLNLLEKYDNNRLLEKIQCLIDYVKNITNDNYGPFKKLNTSKFRNAIRYYYQNLCGYVHDCFDYKNDMNEMLSKQLKFYIKLCGFYPYLLCPIVIKQISSWLTTMQIIHITLLITGNKCLTVSKIELQLNYIARTLSSILKNQI